jgi:GTPase SAR1 family protein
VLVTFDSVEETVEMSEKLFKVIIIGDPTVGKTSFVQRYVQDSFKRDYKGTVGVDFALKIIKWSENETVSKLYTHVYLNVYCLSFI